MKIVNSISTIYNDREPQALKLKLQVDKLVESKKDTWHYYSRIKSKESFALKLETGRVQNPKHMDDLFACTLVVENIKEIKNAIKFIETIFEIRSRKPLSDDFTHNYSSSFQFEDLRLYMSIKKIAHLPSSELNDLVFECQIKTFLQHAWSIATHDLIYKSDVVSWSKERVAYQIKAMLEQAEISISGVDELSKLPELAKNNSQSKQSNEIIAFLTSVFPADALPSDLLRLSGIVGDILKIFQIDLAKLRMILNAETALNKGVKTLDLSPYGIILQSIINQIPSEFERVFKKGNKVKGKVLLSRELTLGSVKIEDEWNVIRI